MEVFNYLPEPLSGIVRKNIQDITEIRIRVDRPIILRKGSIETILKEESGEPLIASKNFIGEVFLSINDYSIYAHQESIRQGYITLEGGHRAGFCGHVVMDNGIVKTINNISSINIRVSHQMKGISNEIINMLYNDDNIANTLIISPPGYGKTTLLRDIIRNISNGTGAYNGLNVSVIDERGEIAAVYEGIPYNDLGMRTDIIENIPKEIGIPLALRTMSPQVIAVDEIGTVSDIKAIRDVWKSGISVIATIHGKDREDIENNVLMKELVREQIFKTFITVRKDKTYHVCD